jgi:hypothetical protein
MQSRPHKPLPRIQAQQHPLTPNFWHWEDWFDAHFLPLQEADLNNRRRNEAKLADSLPSLRRPARTGEVESSGLSLCSAFGHRTRISSAFMQKPFCHSPILQSPGNAYRRPMERSGSNAKSVSEVSPGLSGIARLLWVSVPPQPNPNGVGIPALQLHPNTFLNSPLNSQPCKAIHVKL